MFTGLVEESGAVLECMLDGRTARLTVSAPLCSVGAQIGDSLAINGCCLTMVAQEGERLTFEAIPETLARTNLGSLHPGDAVNLERPLAVGARLGGHFVQGHIDGVGEVRGLREDDNALVIEIAAPASLL